MLVESYAQAQSTAGDNEFGEDEGKIAHAKEEQEYVQNENARPTKHQRRARVIVGRSRRWPWRISVRNWLSLVRPVAGEEECGELSGVSFGRGNGPGESLADEEVVGLDISLRPNVEFLLLQYASFASSHGVLNFGIDHEDVLTLLDHQGGADSLLSLLDSSIS